MGEPKGWSSGDREALSAFMAGTDHRPEPAGLRRWMERDVSAWMWVDGELGFAYTDSAGKRRYWRGSLLPGEGWALEESSGIPLRPSERATVLKVTELVLNVTEQIVALVGALMDSLDERQS